MKTTTVEIGPDERVEVVVKGTLASIVVTTAPTVDLYDEVDGFDLVATHDVKVGDTGLSSMTIHREKVRTK